MNASSDVALLGRRAEDSDALDHAVRVGLVAYGVVHLIIAWLAGELVFGHAQGQASSSGALHQLARQPFGSVLLWITAAGFFALVVWQLTEAVAGHRDKDGKERVFKRLGSGLKVVLYGTLGYTAMSIALGGGSGGSGGSGTDTWTARLMQMPGGQVLVALVGLGIAAYGGRLVWRGLSEGFKKHLQTSGRVGEAGRAFVLFGKVGYVSKGVALLLVAALFVWAALAHDPQKSGGLDQALHTLLQQPFGAPVLLAMAVGIACYGLFCFAWARHLER